VLVENHRVYREGLKELLAVHGVSVVAEAETGEDGVALVARARPDVTIMDVNLPGMSGIAATRRIVSLDPQARVVMLTISEERADVLDAILAGACGYVLKGCVEELVAAVRAAAAGESLLSPPITGQVIASLREETRVGRPASIDGAALSEREVEVLALMKDGRGNAEIAEGLKISGATVKHHVSNILEKLGVENRVQAAVYASRDTRP